MLAIHTMQDYMLLTKKSITKLGTQMNENAGSKPSNFAMKQMEKMGWTEGKGLGKTESGISKHLTITKRDDSAGLGSEAVAARATDATDTWWHDTFATNLKAMQKKSKKSKSGDSKKRKSGDDEVEHHDEGPLSYDDLFKATGGARLGMRARADQKGKLKRTEDQMANKAGTDGSAEAVTSAVTVVAEGATTSSSKVSDSESDEQPAKKAKKSKNDQGDNKKVQTAEEKQDKKDKKAKKEKKSKKDRD